MRVGQSLVKAGCRTPAARGYALSKIWHAWVRWARTDRPAAAEEKLHRAYILKFRPLPEYVRST
jgi:hypothetical protein